MLEKLQADRAASAPPISQPTAAAHQLQQHPATTVVAPVAVAPPVVSAYQQLCDKVAHLIASEKVVGWFQDRMEFGPRALGARSIIGDARSKEMQRTMNLKINGNKLNRLCNIGKVC